MSVLRSGQLYLLLLIFSLIFFLSYGPESSSTFKNPGVARIRPGKPDSRYTSCCMITSAGRCVLAGEIGRALTVFAGENPGGKTCAVRGLCRVAQPCLGVGSAPDTGKSTGLTRVSCES